MPILDIEMVTDDDRVPDGLAARLAEAAGAVFGAGPGRVWVKLRCLPAEHYAENGGGPPRDVRPVFVSVLLADAPTPDAWARLAGGLAKAIGQACGRPVENVHVLLEPPARGRIAFGGEPMGPA